MFTIENSRVSRKLYSDNLKDEVKSAVIEKHEFEQQKKVYFRLKTCLELLENRNFNTRKEMGNSYHKYSMETGKSWMRTFVQEIRLAAVDKDDFD